jgi:type IV pilus assembly protein PilX
MEAGVTIDRTRTMPFGVRAGEKTTAPPPFRQQGVVLFIVLIVLVAMTLAGIAMVRSVDTGNVIAGNLAFKQTTIHAADRGIQAAYDWLVANSAGMTLQNTDLTKGYYSSRPAEEKWTDPSKWTSAVTLPDDGSGYTVSYVIHRMCKDPDKPYNGTDQQCATSFPSGAGSSGGSMAVGATVFEGNPQLYYRITARVVGPRNTVSIVQAVVLLQV